MISAGCLLFDIASLSAATALRIVSYNIEADVNGNTAPNAGLDTVIEAIGEQSYAGVAARPPDIIGLEETTSNTATVAPLVNDLNAYYGAGTYAASPFQATETGGNPGTGNGPSALVYNTHTVTLVASVGVGTPQGSTNGEYRQIARYEFQPVGGSAPNAFYLYVSHMKSSSSGSVSAVQAARNEEAQMLRADAATLPATAAILYTGDFNLDGSGEPAYATLTASGVGQGVDPLNNNPQNDAEDWSKATYVSLATESDTSLHYRDDIQFLSANVFAGGSATGLNYVPGSFRAFGNNGTTAYESSVNATTNTALANLTGPITAAQALAALVTASDHLPVVSDYTINGVGLASTLAFSSSTVSVDEDAQVVSLTVNRTGGTAGPVSVAYSTADGTAKAGVDYTATSGTLTWADGDNSPKGFFVPILNRGLTDGSTRTFQLSLGQASGGTLGTPTQTLVTIKEDDGPVEVTLVATTPVVTAGRGQNGVFTLSLAAVQTSDVVVNFTIKGTAINGVDYQRLKTTKKIKAGETTRTIQIVPRGDLGGASEKVVTLTLAPGSGYAVGTAGKVKVKILAP